MVKSPKNALFGKFHPGNPKSGKNYLPYHVGNFATKNVRLFFSKTTMYKKRW
jgi:hypothetical protein